MSDDHCKRIACIFEEEQVFLTKNGCFYGYEYVDDHFKCRRLNTLEINRFLYRIREVKRDIELVAIGKSVKKPLPRKYEDMVIKEI